MCVTVDMWTSEDTFQELVLSLYTIEAESLLFLLHCILWDSWPRYFCFWAIFLSLPPVSVGITDASHGIASFLYGFRGSNLDHQVFHLSIDSSFFFSQTF